MPIKSVKRRNNRNRRKTMRGGSSVLSSTFSSIKKSLGMKMVTDKNCLNEITNLLDIFKQLKSGYMLLEKQHKTQMREGKRKFEELAQEIKSTQANSERVSIRQTTYQGRVENINAVRDGMNEIYMLFKSLRCVLIKYLFTKTPERLAPVFEEYSTIFSILKDKVRSGKKPLDLALIKECFKFYMENKDKKNDKFIQIFRHDILRLSRKNFDTFYKSKSSELPKLFADYCKKDVMDDEIFEGHHLKLHERFEGDATERNNVFTTAATASESVATGRSKKRRSKKKRV